MVLAPHELRRRAEALRELQRPCQLCPRSCRADRASKPGVCGQPEQAMLALACAHRGEEPPLSGERGAGTIFVAGCNLRCRFCQNWQISQRAPLPAWAVDERGLAEAYLRLAGEGCHNVEWVSPTAHLPALVAALALARERGLALPVVYNTNGYDRPEVLRLLEGVVDVYLPDAKYSREALALELSGSADYVEVNRAALREMWRQVGPLVLDEQGLARRGLVIRHLVIPGELLSTGEVLGWVARELSPEVCVSLMAQYCPAHEVRAGEGALGRPLTRHEYELAVEALFAAGLENGWVQELSSCRRFLPDFDRSDPFAGREG